MLCELQSILMQLVLNQLLTTKISSLFSFNFHILMYNTIQKGDLMCYLIQLVK